MIVDDERGNLKLLEQLLKEEGYDIHPYSRGAFALAAAEEDPPDLVLLDVNMPEMNGFEVCERLKASKRLSSIPVIFLSGLAETDQKVKAFLCGGMDYITKPFQLEEVQLRIRTHVAVQRARRAEQALLEGTLNGAVRAMAELVHFAGPALWDRSESIRKLVVHMAARMELEEPWQYEFAAILCLIGCVSLPAETFDRAYTREALSPEEEQMFRSHPEAGYRLLADIPRLENAATMIRHQQRPCGALTGVTGQGACMLRIAAEIDRRMLKGFSFKTALSQLRAAPLIYPSAILNSLTDYAPLAVTFEFKCLAVEEWRASMILDEDLLTKDGLMVLQKGITLNYTLIERARNFASSRGIREPVRVRIICVDAALPG